MSPGDWLALAAAPVFATMAVAAAGQPDVLCATAMPGPNAMALMYALMALFHLAPWLRRPARRPRAGATAAEGADGVDIS
jgi:hypothetical protein